MGNRVSSVQREFQPLKPSPDDDAPDSVMHRPGEYWSQFDLGNDFDASTLSVIAELDPTAVDGVVEDVLSMFRVSLEPLLDRLEQLRAGHAVLDIRFEAHKLSSAAGQIGALRLARACKAISGYFAARRPPMPETVDPELDALLTDVLTEIVRVDRRLRSLLSQ